MARHRAHLSRESLLERYSKVHGMSYAAAVAMHVGTEIEELRNVVESLEDQRQTQPFPQRRSFARSLPTTRMQGQTR